MYTLGINSAYHESAACLIADGKIVAAAEEERFTRVKHAKQAAVDNPDQLPLHAIQYCLREAGLPCKAPLDLSPIDRIGYSLNPAVRRSRHAGWRPAYPLAAGSWGTPLGEETFAERCGLVPSLLRAHGFGGEFRFLRHHDCHAASAFFVTPFPTSAVLVIDGIGEHDCSTLFRGSASGLERVWQQEYPHSLGFLWEKLSCYLGFSEYDAAKLMALAAYGDPRVFRSAFGRIVSTEPELAVDDATLRFRSEDYSGLERVFRVPPRDSPIEDIGAAEQPYADLAAALQQITETVVFGMATRARTLDSRLCLSGGVALNCVAVGRLLTSGMFDAIYVPPASHDAGTAVGAALSMALENGCAERAPQLSPYLGPSFSLAEIDEALAEQGIRLERCAGEGVEEVIAALLADGYTVGWFHGRMELGPRALGNRSLFADPRTLASVQKLTKVKHRAAFDPFAPAVMQEDVADWFEMPATQNVSIHYMTASYRVRDSHRHRIPAVVHVDGTSRVQVVGREQTPQLHRMLSAFRRLTGVPVVLNTSFNDREPIVGSPADAVNTALRAGLDYLVLEDRIIPLRELALSATVPDLPLQVYFEKLR